MCIYIYQYRIKQSWLISIAQAQAARNEFPFEPAGCLRQVYYQSAVSANKQLDMNELCEISKTVLASARVTFHNCLVLTGTMEFGLTFHSVGNVIIPTDELHDFSDG